MPIIFKKTKQNKNEKKQNKTENPQKTEKNI